MSIYATLWTLRFPRHGDDHPGCEWIEVTAQGVPGHIGADPAHGDPYADFLPPPLAEEQAEADGALRAVVFVTSRTVKGTARAEQEYVDPLLVLTGTDYRRLSFGELHERLCDALRGGRPRLIATVYAPDGRRLLVFDDGSTRRIG